MIQVLKSFLTHTCTLRLHQLNGSFYSLFYNKCKLSRVMRKSFVINLLNLKLKQTCLCHQWVNLTYFYHLLLLHSRLWSNNSYFLSLVSSRTSCTQNILIPYREPDVTPGLAAVPLVYVQSFIEHFFLKKWTMFQGYNIHIFRKISIHDRAYY